MSEEHDLAKRAAALLAERRKEPRPRNVDRMRGIAVVARAINEQQRRKRRRRWVWGASGVAVAAGVTMLAGWFGARHGARSAQTSGCVGAACAGALGEKGRVAGRAFEPGQSLVANQGHSELVQFGPVTRIRLDERSELEYREGTTTRRFGLLRGAIHLRVAKLRPEQRFVVETPDAEVEVRGTEFDVAIPDAGATCGGSRTLVSVREGAGEVRHRGVVARGAAGEHWPPDCVAPTLRAAPQVASASSESAAETRAAQRTAAPPKKVERESASPVSSELAEQNDLFAQATAARQAGRSAEALAAYDRLLTRYPGGPLSESASIGKLRLLRRINPPLAREEARRYLARYPRGMARAEARAVLASP